jgi:hypothetical protein
VDVAQHAERAEGVHRAAWTAHHAREVVEIPHGASSVTKIARTARPVAFSWAIAATARRRLTSTSGVGARVDVEHQRRAELVRELGDRDLALHQGAIGEDRGDRGHAETGDQGTEIGMGEERIEDGQGRGALLVGGAELDGHPRQARSEARSALERLHARADQAVEALARRGSDAEREDLHDVGARVALGAEVAAHLLQRRQRHRPLVRHGVEPMAPLHELAQGLATVDPPSPP